MTTDPGCLPLRRVEDIVEDIRKVANECRIADERCITLMTDLEAMQQKYREQARQAYLAGDRRQQLWEELQKAVLV